MSTQARCLMDQAIEQMKVQVNNNTVGHADMQQKYQALQEYIDKTYSEIQGKMKLKADAIQEIEEITRQYTDLRTTVNILLDLHNTDKAVIEALVRELNTKIDRIVKHV